MSQTLEENVVDVMTADEGHEHDLFDEGKETWVEWIHGATNIAEANLRKAGIDDWVMRQRRKQFKWAGHVTRRRDGRWSHVILGWQPLGGTRSVGRPRRRWTDGLVAFFKFAGLGGDVWRYIAENRASWEEYEEGYCCQGSGRICLSYYLRPVCEECSQKCLASGGDSERPIATNVLLFWLSRALKRAKVLYSEIHTGCAPLTPQKRGLVDAGVSNLIGCWH